MVENPDKHHLSREIQVNINSNMYQKYVPLIACAERRATFCCILSRSLTRTTEGLSQMGEAKETGQLNEMWDPGIEKKNSSGKSDDV